jgi:TnpA family transposase
LQRTPNKLKEDLSTSLEELNENILDNLFVKITGDRKKSRIKITPHDAQETPLHLSKVQLEINKRFSTINLIDVLKEADFRINFSNKFSTIASREGINGEEFLTRLLLCVYAIGSNTGLKRVAGANIDTNYQDLLYFKRRYIRVANIRAATVDVINAIIEIRDPKIWGIMTTGCACDSKKISCWDQNLISQWHTRYRGRGVMIYWHVDQNSACIYSQIKTCTSSEVGSMINGFLKHDSKMDMNKTYTDTHGQSVIGFAISHLLHFELLPRIKGVNKQKLYYVHKGDDKLYPKILILY